MRNNTRPAGIALVGLGLLATLLFLAGPAGADIQAPSDSVGPNANHGSVSSGGAHADWGSTASGNSVAVGGSVASGCATAANGSTASGGDCRPKPAPPAHKPVPKKGHGGGGVVVGTVTGVGGATPATAIHTRSLALTGSSTGPLTAAAAGLLGLGALLVVLTSDRRRTSQLAA